MYDIKQPIPFKFDSNQIATTDVDIKTELNPKLRIFDNKSNVTQGSRIRYSSAPVFGASSEDDLKRYGNKFFVTFKIPEISGLFSAKLRTIDPEIEDLASRNKYFLFIMNSIFNILDNLLSDKGYAYHVDVKYKDYKKIRRAYISVYLENANFDEVLLRWKETGDERTKFFESLKKEFENIWPNEIISQLDKYISIEFDSGD